jgi:hypothetical protein
MIFSQRRSGAAKSLQRSEKEISSSLRCAAASLREYSRLRSLMSFAAVEFCKAHL